MRFGYRHDVVRVYSAVQRAVLHDAVYTRRIEQMWATSWHDVLFLSFAGKAGIEPHFLSTTTLPSVLPMNYLPRATLRDQKRVATRTLAMD